LKDPLVRKYGEEWYGELVRTIEAFREEEKNKEDRKA
jgi:hypothetical protein